MGVPPELPGCQALASGRGVLRKSLQEEPGGTRSLLMQGQRPRLPDRRQACCFLLPYLQRET